MLLEIGYCYYYYYYSYYYYSDFYYHYCHRFAIFSTGELPARAGRETPLGASRAPRPQPFEAVECLFGHAPPDNKQYNTHTQTVIFAWSPQTRAGETRGPAAKPSDATEATSMHLRRGLSAPSLLAANRAGRGEAAGPSWPRHVLGHLFARSQNQL